MHYLKDLFRLSFSKADDARFTARLVDDVGVEVGVYADFDLIRSTVTLCNILYSSESGTTLSG